MLNPRSFHLHLGEKGSGRRVGGWGVKYPVQQSKMMNTLTFCFLSCVVFQYPELLVASYNNNEDAPHEPDGVALIWNMKYQKESPEYIFHCQVKECIEATPSLNIWLKYMCIHVHVHLYMYLLEYSTTARTTACTCDSIELFAPCVLVV